MSKKMQAPRRPKPSARVLGRVLKMLFRYYPVLVPVAVGCILLAAITAAIPAVFMQQEGTAYWHKRCTIIPQCHIQHITSHLLKTCLSPFHTSKIQYVPLRTRSSV